MNGKDLEIIKTAFMQAYKEEHQRYLDAKFGAIEQCISSNAGRINKLENRKYVHGFISGASGFVGGFIAVLTMGKWPKG